MILSLTFACGADGGAASDAQVADGAIDAQVADAAEVPLDSNGNRPPDAVAGFDLIVRRNTRLVLDGRASLDPDGDAIAFSWVIEAAPSTSAAMLTGADTATPEVVVDVVGEFVFALRVDDGALTSAPARVRVVVEEGVPIADAGEDRSVPFGAVTLTGARSHDPDGDPLTFGWTLAAVPPGSSASLDDAASATPSFMADLRGWYLVDLVVNDGHVDSAVDRVGIIAGNAPPEVFAGVDRTGTSGDTVLLGGVATDADADELSYHWAVASSPPGSGAVPTTPDASSTTVVVDEPGVYRLRLTVDDGFVTASDDVDILVGPSVITLTHGSVDAQYSRALERIVIVSEEEGLSILDPVTGDEVDVALPLAPLALSISPDGLQAVVGHDGWMSVVDLQSAERTATWPVTGVMAAVIHGGNGLAYSLSDVEGSEPIHGVELATGVEHLGDVDVYAGSVAVRHPTQSALYVSVAGLSPNHIEKHDIASGASRHLHDETYDVCGRVWSLEDGRLMTGCGHVLSTSDAPAADLQYLGQLPGTARLAHLDHSAAAGEIAMLRGGRLERYTEALSLIESRPLPPLVVDGAWAESHGGRVFFGRGGDALYVVMRVILEPTTDEIVVWRAR